MGGTPTTRHRRDTASTTQPSRLRVVLIGNVTVPLISNGAQQPLGAVRP
jgi:hypothetical protein